jgi:site-specific DNA-methyltransferase (adenine-specific)
MPQIQTTAITELRLNKDNPRVIKDDKFKKLVKSIQEFPQMLEIRPIVVNDEMVVLGGNMRLKACIEAGLKEVPIIKASSLTPEQQKEFIIKDNVGFGEWEWDMLANEWDVEKLTDWGLDIPDYEPKVLEAEEDDFEVPETVQTDIVLGDLFEIGEHRLLCGDSTDSDQVAKLMNGQKADCVITDPPYNIAYKSGTWSKKRKQEMREIENDALGENEFIQFLTDVFNLFHIYTKDTDKYIFNDWKCFHLFRQACINAELKIKNVIVWNKEFQTQALNKFANAHELIIFIGDNKYPMLDINVWNCKRDFDKDHPTPKPIKLLNKAINYSSKENDLVLDFFLGSGSTMVASHQLKRKCYGMELDPKYCQVIIDRMKKLDPSLIIKKNGVVTEYAI